VADTGEFLIESVLAGQLGLGDLVASCSKPSNEGVGARFACTADTEDGRTIGVKAVIELDGLVVLPTNVVRAADLPSIVATVLGQLEDQLGVDLPDDALDCGTETLVVDSANQVVCDLTGPTGEVVATIVTFRGLDTDSPTIDSAVDTGS
jgi:hypothetical protein